MQMPAQIGYSVTAVTPDQQFNGTGNVVPGKTLTFQTDTGYEGTVFIPAAVASNMDTVRTIIEDEIRQVAGLQALGGSVPGS